MFTTRTFKVSTQDGLNFCLLESVDYIANNGTVLRIPAGALSNGASTPREMWDAIPPFGLYWPAAFMHDAAYDNVLLIKQQDGTFTQANLNYHTVETIVNPSYPALARATHAHR